MIAVVVLMVVFGSVLSSCNGYLQVNPDDKVSENITTDFPFQDSSLNTLIETYRKTRILLDSLTYYNHHHDTAGIVTSKIHLAETYRNTGHYNEGLAYLYELFHRYPGLSDTIKAEMYNILASIYFEKYFHENKTKIWLDSSYKYAVRLNQLSQNLNESTLLTSSLNLIGAIEIQKGNYPEAIEILNQAKNKGTKEGCETNLAVLANLSYAYNETGNYEKAEFLAKECLKKASQQNAMIFSVIALQNLARIYESVGDTLNLHRTNLEIDLLESHKDIIVSSLMIKQLILDHKNSLANKKILGLVNEKVYLFKLSWILIFSVMAVVVVGLLIIFLILKNSKKRKELISHKLELKEQEHELTKTRIEMLEQEKQLEHEKAEKYELELKINEQKLVYQSLRQANITLLNTSVKEKLHPFLLKFTRKKDREDFAKALEDLYQESKKDPLSDFERIFVQMHGGFYEKLTTINQDFTRSELQLCALLRMNLPSKEIANLMNLSVSRVDQIRHQIRQKLHLEQNQNLISYLITLQAKENGQEQHEP